MIFKLSDLGPLNCAEIKLSELTIVCGKNNTGKTYATYTIYAFLLYWWEAYTLNISKIIIDDLMEKGTVSIAIDDYLSNVHDILNDACKQFQKRIRNLLSSEQESLSNAVFRVALEDSDISPMEKYEQTISSNQIDIFSIQKETEKNEIFVSLLIEKGSIQIPQRVLQHTISTAIKRIIFKNTFPLPTILVAERTGVQIFQTELDFARNRLLDTIKESDGKINPLEILERVNTNYALPIKRAVDSVRSLKDIVKKQSYIAKEHPEVLDLMNDIIGGNINFQKDSILFIPNNKKRIRLKINEGSSSLRSLVDLVIYIKHSAQKGDLLLIDEPELNLHPENQRKLMHLFAQLVNIGIKIYITTHSDYLIKELNNIILMAKLKDTEKNEFFQSYRYRDSYLIDAEKVSVYLASIENIRLEGKKRNTPCNTFVEAQLSEYGFILDDFDKTIEIMNEIQDKLIYGDWT